MKGKIVIGRVVAPHGVRGDIRIMPLTEKPERFLDLRELLLEDGRTLTVINMRFHKRMLLAATKEITSMNQAELLRGKKILINAEDLPKLEEGSYYVGDLIGLPVFDDTGKELGTFKDAISTGSNDVYVISAPNAKDILIPALKIYIKAIDITGGKIVVKLPEWTDDK